MNKFCQDNYKQSVKSFQINIPQNTPFIETRRGNIYKKVEMTEEYQKEKEIRENIRYELREYFQDDMIVNPLKIDNLIKQIRERKWESLDEIQPEYIIDIDKCELLPRNTYLQKLKQIVSNHTKDEIQQIETFLVKKYNASIEGFKIEANYNVTSKIGAYEKKIKYKTQLENPFAKDKKPYWYEYDIEYDFCHNDSDLSQSEDEENQTQSQHNTIDDFYIKYLLENDSENTKKSQDLKNCSAIQDSEENVTDTSVKNKSSEIESTVDGPLSKAKLDEETNKQLKKQNCKSQKQKDKIIQQEELLMDIEKTIKLKDEKINKKRTFSDFKKNNCLKSENKSQINAKEDHELQTEKSQKSQESRLNPTNKINDIKQSELKDYKSKEKISQQPDNKNQSEKKHSSNLQKQQVNFFFLIC